jgi:hypothetical protein
MALFLVLARLGAYFAALLGSCLLHAFVWLQAIPRRVSPAMVQVSDSHAPLVDPILLRSI